MSLPSGNDLDAIAREQKAREDTAQPITEDWLRSVGFRWHEFERSCGKHWLLWMGGLERAMFSCFEDLGVELAQDRDGAWFCWLRADVSHKYSRFIHLRQLRTQPELISIVVALTGLPWRPDNHLYGSIRRDDEARHIRETEDRLDRRLMRAAPWSENEKDESASGPVVTP